MPPYDLASVTYSGLWENTGAANNRGMTMHADGSAAFFIEAISASVYRLILTTPWELNTPFSAAHRIEFGGARSIRDIHFKTDDGTKLYATGVVVTFPVSHGVLMVTPTDPWLASVSGPNFTVHASAALDAQLRQPTGLWFSDDGTRMWVVGAEAPAYTASKVFAYTLSTPWDITTATFVASSLDLVPNAPLSGQIGSWGLDVAPDGSRFWIDSIVNQRIYEYDLSTPFDVTTAAYGGVSLDTSVEDDSVTGFQWGDDGYKLFVVGDNDAHNACFQYEIPRPPSGSGWVLGLRFGADA